MNNSFWLDGSLYPDGDFPAVLETLSDRVDFLARLCAAWDFGLLPYSDTIKEIRTDDWALAVESCRLLTSPAYHILRRWHKLPPLPYFGEQLPSILMDVFLVQV